MKIENNVTSQIMGQHFSEKKTKVIFLLRLKTINKIDFVGKGLIRESQKYTQKQW